MLSRRAFFASVVLALGWPARPRPPILWKTTVFGTPLTCRYRDTLRMTYRISKKEYYAHDFTY